MQLKYDQEVYRIKEIIKANNKRGIKGDGLQALLKDIVDSNISLEYSTKRTYLVGCCAIYNGVFYICNNTTSGLFNSGDWDALIYTPSVRPEVTDWLARGGTGTQSLKDAYNQLAIDLDPIRATANKRLRLNMFADSSFSNIFVPFLKDYGANTDTNNNFVSADWSIASGLKGNGTTKSINTKLNPTLEGIAAKNFTLGVWNYTAGSVSAADIGCYYGGIWNMVVPNLSGNTWWPIGSNGNVFNTVVSELGLQLATRNGDNNNRKYENTTNTYTTVVTDLVQANGATYIFKSDNVPSVGGYSTRTLGGYVIGDGLSASEVTTLYNALVTFNTAIGR